MAWTFVRPVDRSVLAGRPLLDLGTGDAQTVLALTEPAGLRVGVDISSSALRGARRSGLRNVVAAVAGDLALRSSSFATVLVADVFHHADDRALARMIPEIARVLRPGGRMVAWWYGAPGRGGPGDPRYPRPFDEVAAHVSAAGFRTVAELQLEFALEPAPPTVGIVAQR